MTFKSMMAVVDSISSGRATLGVAVPLARQFACALDIVHVYEDPTRAMPVMGENMSGALVEEMLDVAEERAAQRLKDVQALYDASCGDVDADFKTISGFEDDIIAEHACRADVVLLGRPRADAHATAFAGLKAALIAGGRAVIACPPEVADGTCDDDGGAAFKGAAIFWNGSAAAARAVQGAIPILSSADQVHVFIAEEEGAMARSDDLEVHLGRHGISPNICSIKPPEGRSASTLLDMAMEKGVDLLVMGAYTRSRMRQLIFGSVTAHVLEKARIPVLMMH